MPQTCETRADEARASRNSCGGWIRDFPRPIALQAQFPILTLHCGADLLAKLTATPAFGGGARG